MSKAKGGRGGGGCDVLGAESALCHQAAVWQTSFLSDWGLSEGKWKQLIGDGTGWTPPEREAQVRSAARLLWGADAWSHVLSLSAALLAHNPPHVLESV